MTTGLSSIAALVASSPSLFPRYRTMVDEAPTQTLERTSAAVRDRAIADARACEQRCAELEAALRAIELKIDGLNTKGYKQQKNTQAALDRIKEICRALLAKVRV